VLFELLSGQRPYALDTTRPAEIERIVCSRNRCRRPEWPPGAVLRRAISEPFQGGVFDGGFVEVHALIE
jgi:hypothetical protein